MQTVREVIFFIMCLGEYCAARWLLLPQMTDRTLSWQEKLRLWIPTLLVGVLYAYNGLLSFVSTSMLLFSSVSSGILFLIFCRKLSGKVLIWDAFSMTILFLIKCMVLIIEGFVWQMNMIDINHDIKRSWAEVAVEAGLIILLLSIGNTLRRKKILLLTFCGHYWKWMLFGSIAGEELMGYIMINSWSDMNFPMLVLNIVTIFAGIFLTLILFLLFVLAQIKQEREIMNYQQRSTQEYYEELRRQYEKLGKINHDIKNERACIYHLLEEGNTEKAKEILQAKQKKNSGLREIWTGDSMVDFMVSLKHGEMEKRGISFQFDSEFTKFPISQEECCILLGNLLDNAIEAAEKCREGTRWIQLEFHQHNEIFHMNIKNASTQMPQFDEGKFHTTKKEQKIHGWGLQIVEDLVNKYEGTIKYDYSEKFFEVQITFWNIDRKEGEKTYGPGKRYADIRQSGI